MGVRPKIAQDVAMTKVSETTQRQMEMFVTGDFSVLSVVQERLV